MTKPSQKSVERDARSIARRCLSGGGTLLRRKENHVVTIAEAIRRRWGVSPAVWQAKHVRWFLEVEKAHCSPGTQYRYYMLIKRLLIDQDKWLDWERLLRGPWIKP